MNTESQISNEVMIKFIQVLSLQKDWKILTNNKLLCSPSNSHSASGKLKRAITKKHCQPGRKERISCLETGNGWCWEVSPR